MKVTLGVSELTVKICKMGYTEENLKSIVKVVLTELLTEGTLMDKFLEKVTDKLDRLEKIIKRKSDKISAIENRIQGLSNDFENYKQSNNLQEAIVRKDQQIISLEAKIEQIQQNEKSRNLCMYGLKIPEGNKIEDTVLKVINEVIKVEIKAADIVSCYKIGRESGKVRPIIIKLVDVNIRNSILKKCKNLKGSNIGITEDLVKSRLLLYKKAQEVFDRKSVYIRNGRILVKIGDVWRRIQDENDINKHHRLA